MPRPRVWLAMFAVAVGVGGVWILTDTPPASRSPEGPPAWLTGASAAAPALTLDEMLRQLTENLAGRPLCEAPPVELTEEQKRIVDEALKSVPIPPTDTPGDVVNVHRPLVPC